MFGAKRRAARLAAKLAELDRIEQAPEQAWSAMLATRPAPAAAGVDLAAVEAAVSGFDGHQFLAVARESYFQMREAREKRDARIAEHLGTPAVMAELERTCADDYAQNRRHLLPGIEINHAEITNAQVDGGVVTLVVRMRLIGKEHYVDDAFNIVEGDDEYHTWHEDWTFVRNHAVDEHDEDRQHALMPEEAGGWDFRHDGWNVAAIARVTPA